MARRRQSPRFPLPLVVSWTLALASVAGTGALVVLLDWPAWAAYLAPLTAATFLLYGFDKAAARLDGRRVPEATLHLFMIAGGTAGALLGQAVFRHKTVKSAFRRKFWVLCVVQIALIAAWIWWR